jgi:hypothetical protein
LPLYPEIEAYLADLPRLGLPIVLTSGERGPAYAYSMVYARAVFGKRASAQVLAPTSHSAHVGRAD